MRWVPNGERQPLNVKNMVEQGLVVSEETNIKSPQKGGELIASASSKSCLE
jgi:hypothetical protein